MTPLEWYLVRYVASSGSWDDYNENRVFNLVAAHSHQEAIEQVVYWTDGDTVFTSIEYHPPGAIRLADLPDTGRKRKPFALRNVGAYMPPSHIAVEWVNDTRPREDKP